jgi:hypothetical protein
MNLWNKTKELFVKTCNILVKNKNAVYATFVTLLLCLLWIFSVQIKTSAALIKSHNEKKIILNEANQFVGEANRVLKSQDELVRLQRTILNKQKQESGQMKEALKMQSDMIQKLIQYLKDLGEWPPRPLYDPDKIT